ncbi:DNA-binding protein [Rhodobacter sp. TJ_12]|nr:DNA-binding protein [Rhodobacter sp. TJ_12]
MGKHEPHFTPRLLPAHRAAFYVGVSESKLRQLGIPRRILDGKRLYDLYDLDAFIATLPIEGESAETEAVNTCAGKFGRAR